MRCGWFLLTIGVFMVGDLFSGWREFPAAAGGLFSGWDLCRHQRRESSIGCLAWMEAFWAGEWAPQSARGPALTKESSLL